MHKQNKIERAHDKQRKDESQQEGRLIVFEEHELETSEQEGESSIKMRQREKALVHWEVKWKLWTRLGFACRKGAGWYCCPRWLR